MSFTHFDEGGRAIMVDVSAKQVTHREATARCSIRGLDLSLLEPGRLEDELAVARVAAVLGAKATSSLIPLCHPLPLGGTDASFETGDDFVTVVATAVTDSETGVEMEALTAASLGALSLFRAFGAGNSRASIGPLELVEKRGGRSGTWRRAGAGDAGGGPVGLAP